MVVFNSNIGFSLSLILKGKNYLEKNYILMSYGLFIHLQSAVVCQKQR